MQILMAFKKAFSISVYQLQLNLTTFFNNRGLNCVGPLYVRFFPPINVVSHSPLLSESIDLEPWIWKANSKIILEF